MSSQIIEIITKFRKEILACEIGVMLHDIDKLCEDFFKGKHKLERIDKLNKFCGNKNIEELNSLLPIKKLNSHFNNRIKNFEGTEPYLLNEVKNLSDYTDYKKINNIFDWGYYHHENKKWYSEMPTLVQMFYAALGGIDGLDSEDLKGDVKDKDKPYKQTYEEAVKSNFAGTNTKINISVENIKKLLKDLITELKSGPEINRKKVCDIFKKYYLEALGETRIPYNDVTLYDHSISCANMYKAYLTKVLIESLDNNEHNKYLLPLRMSYGGSNTELTRFKLIGIVYNSENLLLKSQQFEDIMGYYDEIETKMNIVKNYFEEDAPLANEVYRNTSSQLFLIPDFKEQHIEKEVIDIFNNKVLEAIESNPEISNKILISEQPEQKVSKLVKEMNDNILKYKSLPYFNIPRTIFNIDFDTKAEKDNDICPICKINTYNRNKYRVCSRCQRRRDKNKEIRNKKIINLYNKGDRRTKLLSLIYISIDTEEWFNGNNLNFIGNEKADKKFNPKKLAPSRLRNIWMDIRKFLYVTGKDLNVDSSDFIIQKKPYLDRWFIVSSNNTFEVINNIYNKFEQEFSHIKHLIGLNIFTIFFKPKHPLYSVFETVKNFKNTKKKNIQEVQVNNINNLSDNKILEFNLDEIKCSLEYKNNLDVINKEDKFYTYFQENGEKHLKDLKEGDTIKVSPGKFDFIYLNTTTAINDIQYDKRKHFILKERPYYNRFVYDIFNRIHNIIKDTKITRIKNAESILIKKYFDWKSNWNSDNEIVRNLIKTVIKKSLSIGSSEIDFIIDTVINGIFFDALDFFNLTDNLK